MEDPQLEGTETAPAWERRPGEPQRWFDRFDRFRLMGVQRSIHSVYVQERASTGASNVNRRGGVPHSWRHAALRWKWIPRAEAWDEAQRLERNAQWEQRQAELREAEWAKAQTLIVKAEQMLQFPLATTTREERSGEDGRLLTTVTVLPARWSMADAARLIETASRLARLAAQMETDRSRVDLENMTDAQIVELIKKESRAVAARRAESDTLPASGQGSAADGGAGGSGTSVS